MVSSSTLSSYVLNTSDLSTQSKSNKLGWYVNWKNASRLNETWQLTRIRWSCSMMSMPLSSSSGCQSSDNSLKLWAALAISDGPAWSCPRSWNKHQHFSQDCQNQYNDNTRQTQNCRTVSWWYWSSIDDDTWSVNNDTLGISNTKCYRLIPSLYVIFNKLYGTSIISAAERKVIYIYCKNARTLFCNKLILIKALSICVASLKGAMASWQCNWRRHFSEITVNEPET